MNGGQPVVIIEDDAAHRDLVTHLLSLVAPTARVSAFDPDRSDDLADELPFGALVLLDRQLGARDSLDLVPPLLHERADLRIVLMSAFVTPEDRVACLGSGASRVFEKPGDLNGWRSTLASLLEDGWDDARAA